MLTKPVVIVTLIAAATMIPASGAIAATQTCHGTPATIVGTTGDDVINGTGGPDVIVGLSGRDFIDGLDGNDKICGGGGPDFLYGSKGADYLSGGNSPDYLNAGRGNDRLIGGADKDSLFGGRDNDFLNGYPNKSYYDGGLGDDTIVQGSPGDTLSFHGATNGVTVNGDPSQLTSTGYGNDTYVGSFPYIEGSGYADDITFSSAGFADYKPVGSPPCDGCGPSVTGEGGNDIMRLTATPGGHHMTFVGEGGPGDDTIYGSHSGGDNLNGEDVTLSLHGQEGSDSIRFTDAATSTSGTQTGFYYYATGDAGADSLIGGDGPDSFDATDFVSGNDSVDGQGGTDTCIADPGDLVSDCP